MSTTASHIGFPARQYSDSDCRARITHAALTTREPIVFVVDDAANVRSIESLLGSRGRAVCSFDSAASFLRSIDASTPGCVLLNLTLQDATGLDVQTHLVRTGRLQPVIFLSSDGAIRKAVQAIKAGAEDVLELPVRETELAGVVDRAIERDRRQRTRRLELDMLVSRLGLLTPRERQVLGHVIAGRLNKQIAACLGATEKTIKVHRARMMHKMAVRSVAELTRLVDQIGVRPER